jgi:hypothetical protein
MFIVTWLLDKKVESVGKENYSHNLYKEINGLRGRPE